MSALRARLMSFYGREMCRKDSVALDFSRSSSPFRKHEAFNAHWHVASRKSSLVLEAEIYELPARRKPFLRERKPGIDWTEILTSTHNPVIFRFSMKSTTFLTIIMTINWIFEIISFYAETSSTLFDIINALQGVLIFLMFVCLPRPLKLIKLWWNDRGSFQVLRDVDIATKPTNDIQMTSLCKQWWVCKKEGDDAGFK